MSTLRLQALQHPSAASSAVALSNDGSATAQLTTINGGPLAGFRNAVINGNFDIWQRGTSFSALGYGVDRFVNAIVGSSCTMSRQTFALGQTDVPNNPKYFCRMAVTSAAGATNYAIMMHRIEGVQTFAGQTVTVSFYAKAAAARPIAVELNQFFGNGGTPSADVNAAGVTKVTLGTTWQRVTLTATMPSVSGKTLGTGNDDYLGLFIWFDAGSSYNSRTSSLGQQSGTFDIAQIQVEQGSYATAFERRPLATELSLCNRYGRWVPFNMLFYASIASQILEVPVSWTEMRKTPVAAALTADPNTTQAALNNSANLITRLTPYGGSAQLTSTTTGNCYVVGYRSWLDADSMAVKAKAGSLGRTGHTPGPPKTTAQGQGQHSRPRRRGRKKLRGQGH